MLASFILPHLEYCSPLLLGVGKVQANKIEDANHYILRTLTGHRKLLSYQELLHIFKLDTLECRNKQQSLILLFKCIRNIGHKYVREIFRIRETSYNLRGNGVKINSAVIFIFLIFFNFYNFLYSRVHRL